MTNVSNGDMRYRVYNRAIYDVGVRLVNGVEFNIKSGSFQLMTMNDILYIESMCPNSKFFTKKILVPVDDSNKEIELNDIGLVYDESNGHLTEDEISAALKLPVKKMEAWLNEITDQVELHAIYEVAINLDLPLNKIKILSKKMPNKDWLDKLGD